MTQIEFNLIVKALVFTSSTDSCMDSDDSMDMVRVLKEIVGKNPELMSGLDLGGLYIYGTDPSFQESPEINREMFNILGERLKTKGYC